MSGPGVRPGRCSDDSEALYFRFVEVGRIVSVISLMAWLGQVGNQDSTTISLLDLINHTSLHEHKQT